MCVPRGADQGKGVIGGVIRHPGPKVVVIVCVVVGVITRLGGSGRVCSHLDSTDMSYSDEPACRSTYTVEEVARILGISRTTAYESVRRGEIRARRFGRRVVIPTIVVDQLLNATDDLRPDESVS